VCAREFIHSLVTVLTTSRRPTSPEQEDIASQTDGQTEGQPAAARSIVSPKAD